MQVSKLLSWNVNGLRSVAKKGFLDTVRMLDADMLCLQETRARMEQLPPEILNIPGYHSYFVAAERGGYSGVALYSKEEPLDIQIGLGVPEFDKEGRVIIARYRDFSLFNCYFPNGGSSAERLQYKMAFYEAALDFAKKAQNLLICGDVNTAHQPIDLARPKENEKISGFLPQERAWIDQLLAAGYWDTLRLFHPMEGALYSWWDMKSRARERNVGWRIDYFFAQEALRSRLQDAFLLPEVHGSDHCPVGITLERI